MGKLNGKISIITGAGTGIGKGIAIEFAKENCNLVLASRKTENLNKTYEEIRSFNKDIKILTIKTDVTKESDVSNLFKKTIDEFLKLDILVNNSGVFDGGPIDNLPLSSWLKVINVNLTGVFLCTKTAMQIMKKQKGGRIINIGSISAQKPRMDSAPYTTSKHGLVGLTKSTALEGREYGIIASCLHPGNVATERRIYSDDAMAKRSRDEEMMQPEDIGTAAVTMASLPMNVNMLESIVLPVNQAYLGRG